MFQFSKIDFIQKIILAQTIRIISNLQYLFFCFTIETI